MKLRRAGPHGKVKVQYITSFHTILESLKSGSLHGTLYVLDDVRRRGPRIKEILEEATRQNAEIIFVSEDKLHAMSPDQRGMVYEAESALQHSMSLESLCERAGGEARSLVLVLDHIEDPHNVGAILRSADAFGADAVIIPARRASPLTDAAARSSAGAVAWVPVIQVSNLKAAIDTLKSAGYWVYTADMTGKPVGDVRFNSKSIIILGNEGKGASKLLRNSADATVSIPMRGHVDSLNVSVSAAILMYEFGRANPS